MFSIKKGEMKNTAKRNIKKNIMKVAQGHGWQML